MMQTTPQVAPPMSLTVGMIVGELTAGRSIEDILAENPDLEEVDIQDAQALMVAPRLPTA